MRGIVYSCNRFYDDPCNYRTAGNPRSGFKAIYKNISAWARRNRKPERYLLLLLYIRKSQERTILSRTVHLAQSPSITRRRLVTHTYKLVVRFYFSKSNNF